MFMSKFCDKFIRCRVIRHAARESTAIEDTMDTQHTTSREYTPAVTRLAQGRTLALLFLGTTSTTRNVC